jgi:hypothetical protein
MNRIHASLIVASALGLTANLSAQSLLWGLNFDDGTAGAVVSPSNVDGATPNPSGSINDVTGRGFFFGTSVREATVYSSDTPGGQGLSVNFTQQSTYLMTTLNSTTVSGTPVTGLDGRLNGLTAATASMWVKVESGLEGGDRFFTLGGNRVMGLMVSGPTSEAQDKTAFGLTVEGNGGSIGVVNATTFDASDWLFLSLTMQWSEENTIARLYAGSVSDEVELIATFTVAPAPGGKSADVANGLAVGGLANNANRSFIGLMDDFRLYEGAGNIEFIESIRLSNLPEPQQIPEPASFAALAGLVGLGLAASRRRARR